MFKRLLASLLVLLFASFSLPALASPGDVVLYEAAETDFGIEIQGIAAVGDTLYMLGQNEILTYKMGEDTPTSYCALPDGKRGADYLLLSDGEALYCLDGEAESLFQVDASGLSNPESVDLSMLDNEYSLPMMMILNAALFDGELVLLVEDNEGGGTAMTSLWRVPRDGSSAVPVPGLDIFTMTSCGDGLLLCLAINPASTDMDDHLQLAIIQASDGQVQQVLDQAKLADNSTALAYDAANGTAYFCDGSTVQRVNADGSVTLVNYLSTNTYGTKAAYLSGGAVALLATDGLYIRSTDETQLTATPLVIHGYLYEEELIRGFQREHPEIPVVLQDTPLENTKIAEQVRTGDSEVDLYIVRAQGTGLDMLRGGYFMDLSTSAALTEAVSHMLPQVQEAVLHENRLLGYPIALWAYDWVVNEDLRAEFDLAMPETYLDYIDMYIDWYENYAMDYTDIMFTRDFGERVDLLMEALRLYELSYQQPDQPLSFDHPDLRAAFEKILSLDVGKYEDMEGVRYYTSNTSDQVIFDTWGSYPVESPNRYSGSEAEVSVVAPPSFSSEAPQYLPADLSVLALNPNSKHTENAMLFLEYAIEHTRPTTRYMLRTDLNEPVEDARFAKDEAEVQEELEALQAQLAEAKPEEKGTIEDEIKGTEEYLAYLENLKWVIRAEDLENYRALAPMMNLQLYTILSGNNDAVIQEQYTQVLKRMLGGQISVDQAIKELNDKVRMMYMEQL